MNPPNNAQIVKTRLLDLPTGTESLGCLSMTSDILILKKDIKMAHILCTDFKNIFLSLNLNGKSTNSEEINFILGQIFL